MPPGQWLNLLILFSGLATVGTVIQRLSTWATVCLVTFVVCCLMALDR